jgi:hypothetical protein
MIFGRHDAGQRKERNQETGQAAPEEARPRRLSERAPAREFRRGRADGGAACPVDSVNAYGHQGQVCLQIETTSPTH